MTSPVHRSRRRPASRLRAALLCALLVAGWVGPAPRAAAASSAPLRAADAPTDPGQRRKSLRRNKNLQTDEVTPAPEIDAGFLAGGLLLLIGGALVASDRRRAGRD